MELIVISYKNHRLLSQQGFSLIEVMLALLIFLVIALGLVKMEILALQTHSNSVFRDEALRVAEDELSRLKALRFSLNGTANELNQSAWTALPAVTVNMRGGNVNFVRSVQITDIAANVTALKRIDVAVGWNQGNDPTQLAPTNTNRQTTLSTIIAQSD